jgi:hypothetical protein
MTSDNLIKELERYRNSLTKIMDRFTRSSNAYHINGEDEPRFRTFVIEIIDLLNDSIGKNQYSPLINQIFNEGISNFYASPSYKSVEDIVAVLASIITRLKRNPELCNPNIESKEIRKEAMQHPDEITLRKLQELKTVVDNKEGFRSKTEFLEWGSKVEPLLAFNPAYQRQFAADLNMIHANLSAQKAEPLANRMRTILNKAIEQIRHEIDISSAPEAIKLTTAQRDYIHQDRIKELRGISSNQFDLCKLLKFCEELNNSYRANNFFSIIWLTRALIDHVPPIFGFKTFNEVVSNYNGTRSFKENMERLNSSSRKIADQHLHTLIRNSESIPTINQVDFSNDIDVLLAEIYRILKRT